MVNLNLVVVIINLIVINIIGITNSYCQDILKFALIAGFDSNYEELNTKKDSTYPGLSFSNIYDFEKLNLSLFTNLEVRNYSKIFYDLTQEISYKYKITETFFGFDYLRDENDEQNSYYGFYIQESVKLSKFEVSYTGFYKNFLKDYKYGSYKSFRKKHDFLFNNKILSSKKEKDFYHEGYLKYIGFPDFEPKIGGTINKSNIKKEEYKSLFGEINYSKYYENFNYNLYFKLERFDYKKTNRHDLNFITEFYSEFYFYINYFLGVDVKFINNNSNYSDESFKRFTGELYIGILF